MDGSNINKTDIKSLFELAMQSFKAGDINNANVIFRHITEMQANSDNIDELYYKGMSHIYSVWETTKATQCFKKILKLGTTNVNILFDIGIYLYNNNYQLNAINCFDKVLDLTEDINKLHDMTFQLEKISEKNIRYEYYNKILDLQDNNVEDKYCKGNAAYCLYRDILAIHYFKEVAETENQNSERLYNTANKLLFLKEYEAASTCLQNSLNLCDNNIAILCGATKLLYFLKKPNETVECIEKILELQTDDLINLYDLAEFLNSNKILYATNFYQKILSIEKPNYSTQELYIKAVCATILKDKNAVKLFEDALKYEIKDMNSIFWLNSIARRLLVLKEYKFAYNCFQKILNLDDSTSDKNANIHILKAFALKVLEKKKDAIECYENILKLNVSNINLLYDVGLQLSGLDNKTAQKFFVKISNQNITYPNSYELYIKGMSEYFLRNKNKAKEYLEKIDVEKLNDSNILLHIGIVMSDLKISDFAKSCFDKVVKVTPTSELDYINIGTSYKYLMDLESQEIEILKERSEKNYWEAVTNYNKSIFQFNHFSPFIYDFFNKNISDNDNNKTDEDKNKMYHYTSIAGLKGILDKKEFWVTKSDFLNDPSETSYIFEVLGKLDLDDIILDKKDDFINDLKEEVEGEKKDVYILSMSADGDSLPMWRNYSNDDGYNIKVDKNKLKGSFVNPGTYILGKVIYINTEEKDNKEQYKPIKNLLSSIYESGKAYKKENDKLTDEIIKKTAFAHIRLISLFVKHTGFEYEHEYRYAFIPGFWLNNKICESNDRNDNQEKTCNYNGIVNYYPNFRTNGKGIIPYITIPIYGLTDPDDPVIEGIRFSPTLDKTVAKQGIDDYLKLQGLAKIDVKPSSIPFRG